MLPFVWFGFWLETILSYIAIVTPAWFHCFGLFFQENYPKVESSVDHEACFLDTAKRELLRKMKPIPDGILRQRTYGQTGHQL